MNVKKFVLSWSVGFVVMFLLSGLWYQVLMSNFYSVHFADVERAEPLFAWIVIGYIAVSFLFAYIYPIGYKSGPPIKEGMRFGFLMGLTIALPIGLILYGVNTIPLTGTFVDIVYQVVEKTIGGIAIALVYGSGAEAESD